MCDKTVYLGEMTVIGYDVVIIASTEAEAKKKLLAEHRKQHRQAGTGTYAKSWTHLSEELTEASVRPIPVGKVVWP